MLAGCLACLYASWKYGPKAALFWLCVALFTAVVVFTIIFAWYPYSLGDWISGCRRHSAKAIVKAWHANALYYWFTVPRSTFFGGICLLATVSGLSLLCQFRKRIAFKTGALLSVLSFCFLAWYFACRVPARNYNIQVMCPLIYSVILAAAARFFVVGTRQTDTNIARWRGAVLVCLISLAGIGFVRQCLLFPSFLRHGMSLQEARSRFVEVRAKYRDNLDLDGSLFVLTENYEGIAFPEIPSSEWLLIAQTNGGRLAPPALRGYELIEDHFCRFTPRLLGLKLAHTVGGYNFAVYVRDGFARETH